MNIDKAIQSAFAYYGKGNFVAARQLCEKILGKKPKHFYALHLLGILHHRLGRYDLAISCFQKAIQANPDIGDTYFNLAASLKKQGHDEEAITYYHKALQLDPDFAEAHSNLGALFQEHGQYEEAVTHYQRALMINPALVEAHSNLGTAYKEQGKITEAEMSYKNALLVKPDFSSCYSNLLFLMNFNPRYTSGALFAEHLKFAERYAQPLASSLRRHSNECIPGRRLKIGYVSPDFRRHSVAYFIEPVLAAQNRDNFEVFCYSDVPLEDDITERLRGYSDHWRNIIALSDDEVADLIRGDGIDILTDLAGHTAHNRLLVFAQKPAPVQISWIGYPATTGLTSIDYKIVDNHTDPAGMTDKFYTETLTHMPESFLCYLPEKDCPAVGPLPALTAGHITFASFNDFAKVSPDVIRFWRVIIQTIPNARLVMKAKGLSDKKTCQNFIDTFTRLDMSTEKITLLPQVPTTRDHMDMYNSIDIGLDTFPYTGTTTTCEALWMGVPVITLAGNTHASRVGVSLLSNVGLPELIAATPQEYISKAVSLAHDLGKLQSLRTCLRGMMSRSPLTDAQKFTLNLEERYGIMWDNWCRHTGS